MPYGRMTGDMCTLIFVFGLLSLVVLVARVNQPYEDFIKNTGYPIQQLCTMPLTTPISREAGTPEMSGPADATLNKPRDPYNLLGDYLKPAQGVNPRLANLTSECAYIADGERKIELTGSYGQVTNNYKRKKPDNGSTWLHELSLSFYN